MRIVLELDEEMVDRWYYDGYFDEAATDYMHDKFAQAVRSLKEQSLSESRSNLPA